MRLLRGLCGGALFERGSVATIGNFDGVHIGHQRIIEKLAEEGQRLALPVVVVLFEPQPREYFAPEQAPPRLTRLREKLMQLAGLPVDAVMLLRFNQTLANRSPESFIRQILIDHLRVKHLVVGDDFRFGKHRRGDFAQLRAAGVSAGFRVCDTETVSWQDQRVSSTLVREMLGSGRIGTAERLLGRAYSVCGRVIAGDQRGRRLGFPTANIELWRKSAPVQGVFAVTMLGVGESALPGVANVGVRPTIEGGRKALLETHLIDFDQDLYGRRVEVRFHHKLRDEQRFAGLAELKAQIERDVTAARAYFAGSEPNPVATEQA